MVEIKYVPISKLTTHPENPRLIKDEAFKILCESIKANLDYFETRPILCNPQMVVFAGNMRLRAAISNGMKEVPVAIMDVTPEREKELMIRDNVQNGIWNPDLLASHFEHTDLEKWGLDLGQFGVFEDPEVEGEDEAPEPEATTETKQGDIFLLGNHRVMCGDATVPNHFDVLMDGKKADMVFTDPPYNVDYAGGGDGRKPARKKIKNDSMGDVQFYEFLFKVMKNLVAFTEGAFYVCMSSSELHNLYRAFTDAGGHWQTYIIWAKNNFTLSRSDYQHKHEPIMYGLSEKEVEAAENTIDGCPILYGWNKHMWYGGRKQGDVWMIDRPTKSELHPTMKPVALCARAIRNSSKINDIVLDAFGGSGSTLMACQKIDRRCYMMELDPLYVDVIVKRWEEETGKSAVKVTAPLSPAEEEVEN